MSYLYCFSLSHAPWLGRIICGQGALWKTHGSNKWVRRVNSGCCFACASHERAFTRTEQTRPCGSTARSICSASCGSRREAGPAAADSPAYGAGPSPTGADGPAYGAAPSPSDAHCGTAPSRATHRGTAPSGTHRPIAARTLAYCSAAVGSSICNAATRTRPSAADRSANTRSFGTCAGLQPPTTDRRAHPGTPG
jgi:hypothetical protein